MNISTKDLESALLLGTKDAIEGYLEVRNGLEIVAEIKALVEKSREERTLRDYFAAKALNGLLSFGHTGQETIEQYAGASYKYADAMLKERGRVRE